MDDLLKKMLYAGVGIMTATAEKMQETVDKMVADGRLSREDGTEMLRDLSDASESKKDEWEQRLRHLWETTFERFNFVPRAEVETLENRLSKVEARLEILEKITSPATTKTVAKRTVKKIDPS